MRQKTPEQYTGVTVGYLGRWLGLPWVTLGRRPGSACLTAAMMKSHHRNRTGAQAPAGDGKRCTLIKHTPIEPVLLQKTATIPLSSSFVWLEGREDGAGRNQGGNNQHKDQFIKGAGVNSLRRHGVLASLAP